MKGEIMTEKHRIKPLVLIVEYDRTEQDALRSMIEKHCDVIMASSPLDALSRYSSSCPNIVFLDIELPNGEGETLIEDLKKLDPDSYIVMLSNCISRHYIKKCTRNGAEGLLTKPANEEGLLQYINNYNSK